MTAATGNIGYKYSNWWFRDPMLAKARINLHSDQGRGKNQVQASRATLAIPRWTPTEHLACVCNDGTVVFATWNACHWIWNVRKLDKVKIQDCPNCLTLSNYLSQKYFIHFFFGLLFLLCLPSKCNGMKTKNSSWMRQQSVTCCLHQGWQAIANQDLILPTSAAPENIMTLVHI